MSKTSHGRGPGKARKSQEATAAKTSHRLALVLGLGTTGMKFDRILLRREPGHRGGTLVLDGEISPSEASGNDHLLASPDESITDYRSKAGRVPLVRHDPLIPRVELPHDSERGAGACRILGTLKASVMLDHLRQKFNRAVRRRLARLDTQERLVVDVHVVCASCGGFGSGIVGPVTLIVRDEVRKVVPGARCNVVVHLVLSSLFEPAIADPMVRAKVVANDFATFLELNHAQDPRHVALMAELLGCGRPTAPTFDRVIPYHVSDEHGKTATLEQVLTDRVLPNVLASENESLANRIRELSSNALALRHGGGMTGAPHPIVSVSQAAAARVPAQFGESWALAQTREELKALLAKPAPQRIKSFEGPAKGSLGMEAIRTEIARNCSEPLHDVLTQARALRNAAVGAAHAILTETYERYHSAAKTTIEARCRALLENFETVVAPNWIDDLTAKLVERGATVGEVVLTLRGLRKEVDDFSVRVEREGEKAAASVKARQQGFNDRMQSLLARPWRANRVKDQAADALNALINAEDVAQRHRTLQRAARLISAVLAGAEAEALLVHREALRSLGALKGRLREAREAATAQSATVASVIMPEEYDDAVARLDQGIRGVNEALPRLDVKALLRGGGLGVADRVEDVIARRVELFEAYYESELIDVCGTAKLLKLGFSVQRWVESTLRSLACCSPVSLASSGEAEVQTVIAASGDDYEVVQQLLRRSPRLNLVEVVPGTDHRMIVLHRRVEGLTIEAISTFLDARRAAMAFPKPGPGLTAWQLLASGGHVLEAYEQAGLVPEAWLAGRAATATVTAAEGRRGVNDRVPAAIEARNDDPGNGDGY